MLPTLDAGLALAPAGLALAGASPGDFVVFFFLGPSGAFLLLGWWGSPCRVFSSPVSRVLGGLVGFFFLCYLLFLASLLHVG